MGSVQCSSRLLEHTSNKNISCKTLLLCKQPKNMLYCRLDQLYFQNMQVSCKDTAPWFIAALLVPIIAYGYLLKCLFYVTSLGYLY